MGFYLRGFFLLSSLLCFGSVEAQNTESNKLKPIIIDSNSSLNIHKNHSVLPIQNIDQEQIQKTNHGNLNELIDSQAGVDVQDYCVNCGAKRLSINGLRGEHTSILLDGLPLFSSISSVYGIDSISSLSLSEVQVMRGSGSALFYPESIGGSLNLVSLFPLESGGRISYQHSTQNNKQAQAIYSWVKEKSKHSVGGDLDQQNYWDEDNNGVSEFPSRNRISIFSNNFWQASQKLQIQFKTTYSYLEILGGSTQEVELEKPISLEADENDFENGDVRRPYIGDPKKIADYLEIQRADAYANFSYLINNYSELDFNLGSAFYMQDAIYSHAFDYDNQNSIAYSDLKLSTVHNENLFSLFGIAHRQEFLRSESVVMYDNGGIAKDDFNFYSTAAFAQLDAHLNKKIEISSALRFDHLRMNRLFDKAFSKNVLAPRINAKYSLNENISHHLSYGLGYRMPLSFTESAHGTYSDGFIAKTDQLEKSHSLVYMYSRNFENYYFTPSLHYTLLKNMAYDEEPEIAHTGPIEFLNDPKDHHIFVAEFLAGYKPSLGSLIEFSYESFFYDNDYKHKLPNAAIEHRLGLKLNYQWQKLGFNLSLMHILPRDLGPYSHYEDHYNINDGLLGVDSQKEQKAPGFTNVQVRLDYDYTQDLSLSLGVANLLDQTQVGQNDSPAMWHLHDGHAHYDNRHTWGLNRGREAYLKLTYAF